MQDKKIDRKAREESLLTIGGRHSAAEVNFEEDQLINWPSLLQDLQVRWTKFLLQKGKRGGCVIFNERQMPFAKGTKLEVA